MEKDQLRGMKERQEKGNIPDNKEEKRLERERWTGLGNRAVQKMRKREEISMSLRFQTWEAKLTVIALQDRWK